MLIETPPTSSPVPIWSLEKNLLSYLEREFELHWHLVLVIGATLVYVALCLGSSFLPPLAGTPLPTLTYAIQSGLVLGRKKGKLRAEFR